MRKKFKIQKHIIASLSVKQFVSNNNIYTTSLQLSHRKFTIIEYH